jgi:hypothetical protein
MGNGREPPALVALNRANLLHPLCRASRAFAAAYCVAPATLDSYAALHVGKPADEHDRAQRLVDFNRMTRLPRAVRQEIAMNHSAVKLLAMTMTAAALAVSSAHASNSQWLGENVPFDAAADEPQPTQYWSGSGESSIADGEASKWLGENVPFDVAADEKPTYVAFEAQLPATQTEVAGLLLDLPVDSYSETVAFPAMPDYVVDEPLLMIAGLDPMQTP